jgi:hypothetical protein
MSITGYTFEMWADSTAETSVYLVRVTDPFGELVGEVKSLSEETSLRLAHELKKADSPRFRADHGIIG